MTISHERRSLIVTHTIQEACASILGRRLARAITNDKGIHWCVVTAMAAAKMSDDPNAVAALRNWIEHPNPSSESRTP